MDYRDAIKQAEPYIQKAKSRYDALSDRDQLVLKVLAVFIALVLIYLVLWKPIHDWANNAETRYEATKKTLIWMKENAPQVKARAIGSAAGPVSGQDKTILSLVTTSSKQNKLELKRSEPDGDDKVRVWFDSVPFNNLVRWLDQIKKGYGIQVTNISIDREPGQGMVNAKIVLER